MIFEAKGVGELLMIVSRVPKSTWPAPPPPSFVRVMLVTAVSYTHLRAHET